MLHAQTARQSSELGPCVTYITCLAVYLVARIHGATQSTELGSPWSKIRGLPLLHARHSTNTVSTASLEIICELYIFHKIGRKSFLAHFSNVVTMCTFFTKFEKKF